MIYNRYEEIKLSLKFFYNHKIHLTGSNLEINFNAKV